MVLCAMFFMSSIMPQGNTLIEICHIICYNKGSGLEKERGHHNVLSESFLHLPLWPIFRQLHPNFITVRTAYASEIWAQLTKNLLTKSGTERFRENII